MPVVRTDGLSVYGQVITKFSRMGRLLHFLTHGAPLSAQELRYNHCWKVGINHRRQNLGTLRILYANKSFTSLISLCSIVRFLLLQYLVQKFPTQEIIILSIQYTMNQFTDQMHSWPVSKAWDETQVLRTTIKTNGKIYEIRY